MKTFDLFKVLGVVILISFLSSCEYEFIESKGAEPVPPDTAASIISFAEQIAPIFTKDKCIDCHNGSFKFDLHPDNAYNSIITNNLVVPFDPQSSEIYLHPFPGSGGSHNKKYSSLAETDSISKWIYQGALDN
jgi:hypothetical protein